MYEIWFLTEACRANNSGFTDSISDIRVRATFIELRVLDNKKGFVTRKIVGATGEILDDQKFEKSANLSAYKNK